MRLVVAVPHRVVLDTETDRVRGEGAHGSFTLLPRHLDSIVLLEPGILAYGPGDEGERYAAVDGGVLTKIGDEVRVATEAAVEGDRLEDLERTIEERFRRLGERERNTRAALARIETHVVQELFEFEEGR